MIELHWPDALDPGQPDMPAAHLRARQIVDARSRRAGILVTAVASIALPAPVVGLMSDGSQTTELASPPSNAASGGTGAASMTIAPDPGNTPRVDLPAAAGGTGPGELSRAAAQVDCYGGPADADPPVSTAATDGRPCVEVCRALWASGEIGEGPVPQRFTACGADGGRVAVVPDFAGDCAANGLQDIVAVRDDLQDLAGGEFGPYLTGFDGDLFGYPADWQETHPMCGQPASEAIRFTPPGADTACDLSHPNAGILALPSTQWPEAPGADTVRFAHQTAAVTTERDGAPTYRFDAIGLVLRLRYEQDPMVVQAILDSVKRQPRPGEGPADVDADLLVAIAADLRASLPRELMARTASEAIGADGLVLEARAADGAPVSAILYREDFSTEVARSIPTNCPPITATYRDKCGQLANVRGRGIAIVLPNESYYHAFVEAPEGHIVDVVVQRTMQPGSRYALTADEAIRWLSRVDALFA